MELIFFLSQWEISKKEKNLSGDFACVQPVGECESHGRQQSKTDGDDLPAKNNNNNNLTWFQKYSLCDPNLKEKVHSVFMLWIMFSLLYIHLLYIKQINSWL